MVFSIAITMPRSTSFSKQLGTLLTGENRSKRVAQSRASQEEDWTAEYPRERDTAKETLENTMTLVCAKSGL